MGKRFSTGNPVGGGRAYGTKRRVGAPGVVCCAAEPVERRLLWAAHVAGSSTTFATIQAAVDAAPSGGTVTVDAGTYAEQVTVPKPLTIDGARADVDARGSGRSSGTAATESVVTGAVSGGVHSSGFHVLANDVTIDGFTVTGETSQDEQLGAGVVIGPNTHGAHVTDDVIVGNVTGIFLANNSGTDPALIQHCYVASNNNAGTNGGRGLYTDEGTSGGKLTNVTVDANTFYNNRGSSGTTGYEAALAFEAGAAGDQSNIRITNNSLTANGKAVLFFHATNVLVQGNTITQTKDQWSGSLRFEGDVNNVRIVYNNLYANTGPAVAVDCKGAPGDNYGFVVNYNNVYGNNTSYSTRVGVCYDASVYDGTFDARYNYWGSASGPSGQGSGTGDGVGGAYRDPSTGWHLDGSGGSSLLWTPFATATVSATATAPSAPAGLTATATGATAIALAWTDTSAGNATGFVVQRSADGGNSYAQIATVAAATTTCADSGLTAGATYAYRVYATNAVGTSAASNTATVTTPAPVVPTAPSGLTAALASATSATLQWTATAGQTAYAVDRSTNGGATWTTVATPTATTYTDVGLSASTIYAYQVRATNAVGTSAASNTTTVTTPAASTTVGLTTLPTASANVGWGTLGTNVSIKGNPITLRGTVYKTGMGAHASSTITYALGGKYTALTVDVGVDDEAKGQGAVDFRIQGDGVTLYDSGVVTGKSAVGHAAVDLTGVKTLTLLATPGVSGTIDYDHADWAGPVLTVAAPTPTATAAAATARTGAVIGSTGLAASPATAAFDGSLSTYFDAAVATGNWVGLDLGTAQAVSQISFASRSGYASRMVGGMFQASTSATFATGVTTLYTVTATPATGMSTTVTLASPVTARYVRYLSPTGSYGDVAEVVFLG